MISLVLYKFYKCTVSVSEGPTIHYSHARTYLYLTAPDALATAASASAAAAASLAVLGEKPKEATACVAASASSRRACEMARLFGELARSDESAASGSVVVSSAFRLPTEGNIEISVTRGAADSVFDARDLPLKRPAVLACAAPLPVDEPPAIADLMIHPHSDSLAGRSRQLVPTSSQPVASRQTYLPLQVAKVPRATIGS